MSLPRPSLDELYAQAKTLINIYLPGADANLEKNVLNIIAIIMAQMDNGLYGYLAFLSLQPFADTCLDEFLDRLAAIRGLTKKAAQQATGNVDVTGTNGAIVTEGLQLQRLDGVFYTVTADVEIAGGVALVNVIAQDVGQNSNCVEDTQLNFVSPPVGVTTSTTVDADGIAGGTDLETQDEFRARYLDLIRNPPQGGAKNDYEIWARQVPGVTKAFVYPLENGFGTVTVRFLVEPTEDNPNGIPTPEQVTQVAEYIETKRPVTAKFVTVEDPTPVEMDFIIHLEVTDNIDIRNSVIAQLQAMLLRDAVPQGSPESEISGTIYLSRINEAISLATGEFAHILISPSADAEFNLGEIAVYGSTSFV